ncbi:MAG: DNA modification methylase [Pseudomonadota bacterium]
MAKRREINLPKGLKEQAQARSRERHKARQTDVGLRAISHAPRNDLVPTLKLELRNVGDLKQARRRARKTMPEQLERVINGIKAFGYSAPVLIDGQNRIVDGHIVVEAVERLGITSIQCVVIDHLTDDELRVLRLSLNRLVEKGEWHIEELALEFEELKIAGLDLQLSGFELPEIDIILGVTDVPSRQKPSPVKLPKVAVSQKGDLFQLGDHRLLCANFKEPDAFERLMDGRKIDCVFSDPPYNLPIENNVSGLGKVQHEEFEEASGEMTDEQFQDFLTRYLTLCKAHAVKGAVIFACMDWRQIDLLLLAGRAAQLHRVNMAVWNKGTGGMGGLYRSTHELVAVFCTDETPATNNVQLGQHGRNRNNVWDYPSANNMGSSAKKALGYHPTPKPIELVIDALLDVTHPGHLVVDPFMGSGTTIIAAERCGRICYGFEVKPVFVDATIKRWEAETGKNAVHVATGKTFAELTAERSSEDLPAAAE